MLIKLTVYPSNKSSIVLVVLVRDIPSTLIAASEPAIFCLVPFVVVLSILDKPDPTGLSVAVTLRAFPTPVDDFSTRLYVPSPAPTMLAVTS